MRTLFALALLGLPLLGAAGATPPLEPHEFSASMDPAPRVGEDAALTFTVTAHGSPAEARFRLAVPEWVHVESDPVWTVNLSDGQSETRTWTVRATRSGFWAAGLQPERADGAEAGGRWCCLYAYSSEGNASLASADRAGAVPPLDASATFKAVDVDGERAGAIYSATSSSPWQTHAGLAAELKRADGTGPETYSTGRATANLTFGLQEGERVTFTAMSSAVVRFASAWDEPLEQRVPIDCRNVAVERRDGEVAEADAWGCAASATRPGNFLPAPAWLAAASLAFAAMRRRV